MPPDPELPTDIVTAPVIVWFRRDLRVADNRALSEAARGGAPVLPVYILEEGGPRPLGGAAKWWLHHSLKALGRALDQMGTRLILRRGRAADVLAAIARESGARTILWNRRYDRHETGVDCHLTSRLVADGLQVEAFEGALLFDPKEVVTRSGQSFRVFTPFWRACLALPDPARPLPRPHHLTPAPAVASDNLTDWRLLPGEPDWSTGIAAAWTPGEDAATARLADFLEDGLADYEARRDLPDMDATSRLSPHLSFGEITPRQVWHAARAAGAHPGRGFLRELGWREFSQHSLYHMPNLTEEPQKSEFDEFPWINDPQAWKAFVKGATGYPIVDAGIRALWETGWLHNRVRMIVASFLVKDLMISWKKGEAWFWDTLVDADPANNAGGWQWVAGLGFESAPFFRIFNPVLQGRKFDPYGHYVRRWIPELDGLPDVFIHQPWTAPADILAKAGIVLGRDYPLPIVNHELARRRALRAFEQIKADATLPHPPPPDAPDNAPDLRKL